MRFMMLMIPKGYEKAKPGTMPYAEAVASPGAGDVGLSRRCQGGGSRVHRNAATEVMINV